MACRAYTLPREEKHHNQKDGSKGTPKLGPYWKLQPVAYKVNLEWKSEFGLENFTGRIIFMSMFNDISWGSKDNKKECEVNVQLISLYAKRFGAGQWSFLGPRSEKKWYSISEDSLQGEWDKMAEKMMVILAESGHPVFRATSPLS